jgi:glycosyltransferase involved in cell wall biosynthesis
MMFSVVIPTYNRRALLERCLASVRAQTFEDYEIVVVDDGSTDGTVEMLNDLGSGRLKIIVQDNAGPGAARNRGVAAASGRYLAFLDSDDFWFPWTLFAYVQAIEQCGNPAFIAGTPYLFEQEDSAFSVPRGDFQVLQFADYLESGDEWRWVGAGNIVISRTALVNVGCFMEENVNAEDADLVLKLGVLKGFVQVTAPYTFAYRQHPANVTKDVAKTLAGLRACIYTENEQGYPGGVARERERLTVLSRYIRPTVFASIRCGNYSDAWAMYKATLRWHLRLGRYRFLLGVLAYFLWFGLRPHSNN